MDSISESMDKPVEQDPRVYFAAERTFLAWIRTGLALMGIGFAVSRFGLFLRQVTAAESHLPTNIHATGLSLWSGVALLPLASSSPSAQPFVTSSWFTNLAPAPGNPAASHATP
jgi:uncharacterized membrane protein YidH (DUF202 family)